MLSKCIINSEQMVYYIFAKFAGLMPVTLYSPIAHQVYQKSHPTSNGRDLRLSETDIHDIHKKGKIKTKLLWNVKLI